MYFPKPALNENDLAIIERGDTAEHSIEAGQCVSWKGKLGKANAAILQGATLDDSLFDYDADGVFDRLSDTGWVTVNQYLSYRKFYKTVYLHLTIPGGYMTSSWKELGVVPEGARPYLSTVYFSILNTSGNVANVAVNNSTGQVVVAGGAAGALSGQVSYSIE